MGRVDEALDEFRAGLEALGWVTDVLVGGSLASGDHRPGVSDLDLVALVDGPMAASRRATVRSLHAALDAGSARGLRLGCAYVEGVRLGVRDERHPTWTHGRLVDRRLSPLARAELWVHGYALHGKGLRGRAPQELLPAAGPAEVRAAVRAELEGYWTWAVRRPWLWFDVSFTDLALVTMARARYSLAHGDLVSKGRVLDDLAAPPRVARAVRLRREGRAGGSSGPLAPAVAATAWCDAVRTIRSAAR